MSPSALVPESHETPSKMPTSIPPPDLEQLLKPLLASLPAAAVSPQPPTALLPLLSPILRQRVQLLSSAESEPWLPLLCYNAAKVPNLQRVARDERLESHPVSGEIEIDWESPIESRYKRIDEETLQTLVTVQYLGLSVTLIWCVNDEVGGGDGWRIGEVGVPDDASSSWGVPSIAAAESAFKASKLQPPTAIITTNGNNGNTAAEDDDEDDDYWAQYDKTPGHTPAPKPFPAPANGAGGDEASYYAQYASVQPAMDNHDPDEAQQNGDIETSLGRDEITRELQSSLASHNPACEEPSGAWSEYAPHTNGTHLEDGEATGLAQPRPSSSEGSTGSDTVARLERAAQGSARGQSEIGIKQHISSSMKSLYRLAKVGGIEREEFERLVRTELDCLSLMDEDDV
jgi:hypothetical protein